MLTDADLDAEAPAGREVRPFVRQMPVPPKVFGGHGWWLCSAVSYFSARVGSIIGAGRLSFRVRDGSGRFPVAVAAVTLLRCVIGGGVWCGELVLVVACV
jgi:hypothetical protein